MGAKEIVHIIDDDDALRDSLTFLLSSAGIEAKSYESAGTYLNDPQRGTCGCIITDVRMPGMSGIDLLRKLKSDAVSVPVIVMTGHGDVPLAVEAMKLGALDFIEKPFDDDALLASVRARLARRGGIPAKNPSVTRSRAAWRNSRHANAGFGWIGRRPG
jgi:two-component system response regulator FixJ